MVSVMAIQLEERASLWGIFPDKFPGFTDLLAESGYAVGCQDKGWGPGSFEVIGHEINHDGQKYQSFEEFIRATSHGRPFTLWSTVKIF